MRKIINSILVMMLVVLSAVSLNVTKVDASNKVLDNIQTESDLNAINNLFSERNLALINNDEEKVLEIEERLKEKGMKEIPINEVKKILEENNAEDNSIFPYYNTPSTTKCKWWNSGWITYTYTNGTKYQVQSLIASPNGKVGKLQNTGNYTVNKTGFKANALSIGVENFKTLVSSTVLKGIKNKIPFYDIVKPYVASLSPTTTITNAKAMCSYSYTQNVAFNFVRKTTQKEERYTMRSNQVQLELGYQIPSFSTSSGVVSPKVIQKKVSMNLTTDYYNNPKFAVASYLTTPAKAINNGVIYQTTYDVLGTKYQIKFPEMTTPIDI